jgi:hypothetical protein
MRSKAEQAERKKRRAPDASFRPPKYIVESVLPDNTHFFLHKKALTAVFTQTENTDTSAPGNNPD